MTRPAMWKKMQQMLQNILNVSGAKLGKLYCTTEKSKPVKLDDLIKSAKHSQLLKTSRKEGPASF